MIQEFKTFAIKGNLIDMAVGVVMGGAFGKVVSSFIDGIVMPAVGMISGGVDFTQKKIILKNANLYIIATKKNISRDRNKEELCKVRR